MADPRQMSAQERAALTPIRQKAVALLEKHVPLTDLSSDDPRFKEMTGEDTTSLNKVWNADPKSIFTTCNAFNGWYCRSLGARPGSQLSRGLLQLDLAAKDVPNCFIKAAGGGKPKPGDIYVKPYRFKDGSIQKMGHVGILYRFHDDIFYDTVDGGQGGRLMGKDYIKWKRNHIWSPNGLTGWVDVDIYFAGRPV